MLCSLMYIFWFILRLKQEAIKHVLAEQHKNLRASAAIEREKAVAASLRVARQHFSSKLVKVVESTKVECQKTTQEILENKNNLHQAVVEKLNER